MPDLAHIQQIRGQLPATTSRLYLNTGTFGPLPTCTIQAIQERFDYEYRNGRLGTAAFETMEAIYSQTRKSVAQLLHADVREIALTDNTGEGINIICYGFKWNEGDEVITTNHEHISALAPLYQLRDRYGVVIRIADLGSRAEIPAETAIAPLITSRTRLIVLSHVTWTNGTVLDINKVADTAHQANIPVLVDGAQSAGAIPLDMKTSEADFYAIPMQKWLCGPDGTGALYVRHTSRHYVQPTYVGYFSTKHEDGIEWELHEHAQRFELGGRQTAALAGQSASLNWLKDTVGHQWLFERISSLHSYAYQSLQQIPGLTLLTHTPGASGLISFTLAGKDAHDVVQQLYEKHNIYVRSIPATDAVRISTGFYNTEEEIDTLVQALQEC